jgi:hypothetical protein
MDIYILYFIFTCFYSESIPKFRISAVPTMTLQLEFQPPPEPPRVTEDSKLGRLRFGLALILKFTANVHAMIYLLVLETMK